MEAQSRERIGIGIASHAISRNPTMRIAVKAVIEVDRAMKGNIEQRPQLAAGKRHSVLTGERAIGWWRRSCGRVVELPVIAVPGNVKPGRVGDAHEAAFESCVGIHFDFVDVALVAGHFDANAGSENRVAVLRHIEAVPQIGVEICRVVRFVIDRADSDPAAIGSQPATSPLSRPQAILRTKMRLPKRMPMKGAGSGWAEKSGIQLCVLP